MTAAQRNDKADRKAAAAHATDPAVYKVTEFGRKRLASRRPVKVAIAVVVLLSVPFVFIYRRLRGAK